MLEEISNIGVPTIKNKIHNIYNDKKRAQSPNLIISNLSHNKNEDYPEEEEDIHQMLPNFEDRKHQEIDKEDIDSYSMNMKKRKFHNNLEHNYDYENQNFNEESNIQDKNCFSEFDYRNENAKNREFESIFN